MVGFRRATLIFLCVLILLFSTVSPAFALPSGLWTDAGIPVDPRTSASNAGRGGTSASDAYLIGTGAELAYLASDPASTTGVYFKLTADIDLSAHYWTPIGTSANPFRGFLDGDGYIISEMTIDTTATTPQGLVARMGDGSIRNLFVSGSILAPNANLVGMLVGSADGAVLLKNVRVDGTVSANRFVGGMVGRMTGSSISTLAINSCVANVTVLASMDAGGMIGHVYGIPSMIVDFSNSAALGNVTTVNSPAALTGQNQWEGTGGFIGQIDVGAGGIDRCYATGNVTGVNNIGGFVGLALGPSYGKVTKNCYASGTVSGELRPFICNAPGQRRAGGNAGGFIGANDLAFPTLTITSCYSVSLVNVTTASSSALTANVGAFAGLLSNVCLSTNHVVNNFFNNDINPGLAAIGMTAATGLPADATIQTNVNPPQIPARTTAEMKSPAVRDALNYNAVAGAVQVPSAWFTDPAIHAGYPVLACQTISFTFADLSYIFDGTAKQATVTAHGEMTVVQNSDWWVFYDNLKTPLPIAVGVYDVTVRIPGYVALTPLSAQLEIVAPAQTYTITATAGTGGSISPSGAVVVAGGATQTFTITAVAGYRIKDIIVDGVSRGASGSVTFTEVSANHTVHVVFEPIGGDNGNNGDGKLPEAGDGAPIVTALSVLIGSIVMLGGAQAMRRKR